jgi:hypothetical protein
MEAFHMNRLKKAAAMLMVTGISLGIGSMPAIAAVTSGGHRGSPEVFHCC